MGAFGAGRCSVRNAWAAVTRVTWWCQPGQDRPASEVVRAQAVLEFAVVVLDAPADLGQTDQGGDQCVGRQAGQPVAGGRLGAFGPLDQQPAVGQHPSHQPRSAEAAARIRRSTAVPAGRRRTAAKRISPRSPTTTSPPAPRGCAPMASPRSGSATRPAHRDWAPSPPSAAQAFCCTTATAGRPGEGRAGEPGGSRGGPPGRRRSWCQPRGTKARLPVFGSGAPRYC